ncbi:hypothetical protein PMAA_102580 [Talaromyces marneffei ATCC 18224]|uniref:Uncharacterized protein n=1 Tax=Talaromyces marneffei (strain ATCC 18224 / CBS 334.59 / QM 7333) TaxID=441960 RepID=B6QWL9_TALMQ|nr:hypothetical protein PMAA_102580 [Talaromyces marneffei ATCC 18224]
MSQRRTAEDILEKGLADLEITQEFLEIDHTAEVYHFRAPPGVHPRTAAYNITSKSHPLNLLRLLCVRDLAIDYTHAWQDPDPSLRARVHGTTEYFIVARGLPEGTTKKALKIGQKWIDLEKKSGIPGISLVLMSAWYMLEHFSDIDDLVRLLWCDEYKKLRAYSACMSLKLAAYQRLYCFCIY